MVVCVWACLCGFSVFIKSSYSSANNATKSQVWRFKSTAPKAEGNSATHKRFGTKSVVPKMLLKYKNLKEHHFNSLVFLMAKP